jgi:hypothetical protein
MVRYSFLVRLSHPLLHAGLSRRIFDHLIRLCQRPLRNRQTNLLGGLEVDNELDFIGCSTGRSAGLAPL